MLAEKYNLRTLFQILILLVSLGWIVYLLADNVNEHGISYFLPTSWFWLGWATVLLMLSMLPNAFIFWKLISRKANRHFPWQSGLLLHMKGQIVRYLPGRFWGVLYQINAAKNHLSSASISKANIDLMLISLLGNLFIPLAILCYFKDLPQWVFFATFAAVILGYFVIIRLKFYTKFFNRLLGSEFLPKKLTFFLLELQEIHLDKKLLWLSCALFFTSWVIYLGAWQGLVHAYTLTTTNFAVLCAWYSIAWLIGFIAAFTPGGLGIREASFVFLAQQSADTSTLVFIAVIARFWLLLADILLVLSMALLLKVFTRK